MKLLVATEMIGGDPTELEARPPRNAPARPKLRNFHTTWARSWGPDRRYHGPIVEENRKWPVNARTVACDLERKPGQGEFIAPQRPNGAFQEAERGLG